MSLLKEDTLHLLTHLKSSIPALVNKRVFITGGTGFFGKLLLETFTLLEEANKLNLSIVVLSRDPEKFRSEHSAIANHSMVTFCQGDISSFDLSQGHFDYIIHAATDVTSIHNSSNPAQQVESMVEGTERVLELAKSSGASRILFTSSGAVYSDPLIPYGEGKLKSEQLGERYSQESGVDFLIARCFAFVGPYLPLDSNFAIGNFIEDLLQGRDIVVSGDGSAVRSYLYATDLVIELIELLVEGESCKPRDIGSSESISIRDLAHLVAKFSPSCSVKFEGLNGRPGVSSIYLPPEGITPRISLEDAVGKTIKWHQSSLTK